MLLWIFTCKFYDSHFYQEYIKACIAGLCGNSVFNYLSNCQTVFQSNCSNFHSHLQYVTVPISSHHCQYLLLSISLIVIILVGVKCCLIVVLTCFSLMISYDRNLCIYLLHTALVYLLWRNLFESFLHFLLARLSFYC